MSTQKWAIYAALIAVGSVLLIWGLHLVDRQIWRAQERAPLYGLNADINDLAFQLRRERPVDGPLSPRDVVIIDIDEASIAELGRLQTWPRSYTARILSYVTQAEPAAIALDLLYTEPDTLAPAYADKLRRAGFARPRLILQTLRSDPQLADAIRASGRTYLALFNDASGLADASRPPDSALLALPHVQASPDVARRFERFNRPVLPIPEFRDAARGIAPVMLSGQGDGTIRRYATLQRFDVTASPDAARSELASHLIPTFGLRIALDALSVPLDSVTIQDEALLLGTARRVPIRDDGTFRINWLGKDTKLRRISYHKVLKGQIPPAFFNSKYVFVGASAVGVEDLHPTPMDDKKPGVEIHAEAFLNLVNGSFLSIYATPDLLPLLFVLLFLMAGLFLLVKPLLASAITGVLILIEFFGYVLFVAPHFEVLLPAGTIILATGIVFVGSTVVRYLTEEHERRRLQNAFSAYVSPAVASLIAEKADIMSLGGEEKELTVMFADVRNFTRLSEQLTPTQLVSFLNDYFRAVSAAVLAEDGTIDKYIGDAMMAFFGAPIDQPDHAVRACRAAVAMIERLDDVTVPLPDTELSVAIGISTGPMVAGNIGSAERFDYTVIGDAVNVGDRVEGINRVFGTTMLVSETTRQACADEDLLFRLVGTTQVKGRDEPVRLFELMAPRRYNAPDALVSRFEAALSLYHSRAFDDAMDAFEDCLEIQPGDGPSLYYREQCRTCADDPDAYRKVLTAVAK